MAGTAINLLNDRCRFKLRLVTGAMLLPIRKCNMVHCKCTMVHYQCTMVHCQCTMLHRQYTMVLFLMGMLAHLKIGSSLSVLFLHQHKQCLYTRATLHHHQHATSNHADQNIHMPQINIKSIINKYEKLKLEIIDRSRKFSTILST